MKKIIQTFFLKQKIGKISLRGRVALCITCLEIVIQKLNNKQEILEKLVNHLWEFTSIDIENFQLFKWQENLLNDRSEIGIFLESSDSTKFPDIISKLIWYTIEVITDSFGGSTKDYINTLTKETTFKAFKLIRDNFEHNFDISIFLKSKYKEKFEKYHGFGKPVPRYFFQDKN